MTRLVWRRSEKLRATCENGSYKAVPALHDKDGVAGSIPAGGSTNKGNRRVGGLGAAARHRGLVRGYGCWVMGGAGIDSPMAEADGYAYEPRHPIGEPLDHYTGVGTGELRTLPVPRGTQVPITTLDGEMLGMNEPRPTRWTHDGRPGEPVRHLLERGWETRPQARRWPCTKSRRTQWDR